MAAHALSVDELPEQTALRPLNASRWIRQYASEIEQNNLGIEVKMIMQSI